MKKLIKILLNIFFAIIVYVITAAIILMLSSGISFQDIFFHPHRRVVIDEAEQKLIATNNTALEESIMKNVTEDGVYNFNELVPFEWDTVYFIKPYIKDNLNVSVRNIYERVGCYWDYVYDIGDPSDPYAQTHIIIKKNGKVIAYRPNMPFTKPFYMYLYKWSDGEFKSADNPTFEIAIEEYGDINDEMSNKGICLKTKEQSLP